MRGWISLVLWGGVTTAFGFIDTGHMVVADLAWRDLKPAVRKRADALLATADIEFRNPLAASCWADDFKTREDGPWHYINLPFRKGDTSNSFSGGEQNVVWAIKRFSTILGDKKQPAAERQRALTWLLHFVGDIHQPLHGTSRPSEAWPTGDRGGNEYKVKSPTGLGFEVRNLHFLWDIGCGAYGEIDRPVTEAAKLTITGIGNVIRKDFPRKSIANLAKTDPMFWAQESRDLAVDFVYSTPENEVPNNDYLKKGRQISRKRIATAGYRLADLINRLLQ